MKYPPTKKPDYKISPEEIKEIVDNVPDMIRDLSKFKWNPTKKIEKQDREQFSKLLSKQNEDNLAKLRVYSKHYAEGQLHRGISEAEFREEENRILETYEVLKKMHSKYVSNTSNPKTYPPPESSNSISNMLCDAPVKTPPAPEKEPIKETPPSERMKSPVKPGATGRTFSDTKVQELRAQMENGLKALKEIYDSRQAKVSAATNTKPIPIDEPTVESDSPCSKDTKSKSVKILYNKIKQLHSDSENSVAITDLERDLNKVMTDWKKDHLHKTNHFTNNFLKNAYNGFCRAAGFPEKQVKTQTAIDVEKAATKITPKLFSRF